MFVTQSKGHCVPVTYGNCNIWKLFPHPRKTATCSYQDSSPFLLHAYHSLHMIGLDGGLMDAEPNNCFTFTTLVPSAADTK